MANELKNNLVSETLVTDLKQIILQARQGAYAAVNACMISTDNVLLKRNSRAKQELNMAKDSCRNLLKS